MTDMQGIMVEQVMGHDDPDGETNMPESRDRY